MRIVAVFIAVYACLSSWQCATAKELVGVQVSRGPGVYSGGNACGMFSDSRVIYHNEVHRPEGGKVLVIFETEDKSQISWPSLLKKFELDELAGELDRIKAESEEAPAGSPSYWLVLFYSDKSSESYNSLANQRLIDLYSYLEGRCWDTARGCIPIIRQEYPSDFFKSAITAHPDKVPGKLSPESNK